MKTSELLSMGIVCLLLILTCEARPEAKPGKAGKIGNPGPKKASSSFCPLDSQTAKYIKEISRIVKGQSRPNPSQQSTASRGRDACEFPFRTDCGVAAFRFRNASDVDTLEIHMPLVECCQACHFPEFTQCVASESCEKCIREAIRCMLSCIVNHTCPVDSKKIVPLDKAGRPGEKGQSGKQEVLKPKEVPRLKGEKGDSGVRLPTRKRNQCETRKVKNGDSYCIERSCIPIV